MNHIDVGSAAPVSALSRMLETMRANMSVQLDICSELERIADTLPDNIDRQACLRAAQRICPAIRAVHEFEEKEVFPTLRAAAAEPAIDQTIERLRFEHWEDESFAAELQETLQGFVRGEETVVVESLAYMLRGFFEGMRRHVAFEREYVMPLIKRMVQ